MAFFPVYRSVVHSAEFAMGTAAEEVTSGSAKEVQCEA
jgi:hypothetical protein